MPSLEQGGKHRSALAMKAPGLLLLDGKQRPIFYNAEALRILNYSGSSNRDRQGAEDVAAAIRSMLLSQKCVNRGTTSPAAEIFWGARQYSWQTFAVFAKSGKPSRRITAVLIEVSRQQELAITTMARKFHLSEREEETVSHLTLGLTSKEIAARMEVSPNTVKAFLRNIMNKMSVSTRSGILGKLIQR